MKSYTLHDLGMNVSGDKFLLPFDVDEGDETILEKTVKMISDAQIYERNENDQIKINEWDQIEMKCLYEGNDDYYPFTMIIEVFRYKKEQKKCDSHSFHSFHDLLSEQKEQTIYVVGDGDEKNEVKDRQWMASFRMEHSESGLLDELIDLRVMPSIIKKLNLKVYHYRFN
jgi:hypothetical protein